MNQCDYCGREDPEEATHCGGCGKVLLRETEAVEPLAGSEAADWIIRAFRWALEQYGADVFCNRTELITPTREHFPDVPGDPAQRVASIFERIKTYAGMKDWACKLVAQGPDVNPVVDPLTVVENAPHGPAGTFSMAGAEPAIAQITYNPDSVRDPMALVAMLAHELAHYLGQAASEPPPGGEKNWEFATDLTAVYMGFGFFLCNAAVRFRQFTGIGNQGWVTRRLGYLSEFELTYCLAVFVR